jgi:hypothetical protein
MSQKDENVHGVSCMLVYTNCTLAYHGRRMWVFYKTEVMRWLQEGEEVSPESISSVVTRRSG